MKNFLLKLFSRKSSSDLKRDDNGYVIANRQGVDVKPNEQYDCVAPAFRFDTDYEKDLVKNKIKQNTTKKA